MPIARYTTLLPEESPAPPAPPMAPSAPTEPTVPTRRIEVAVP